MARTPTPDDVLPDTEAADVDATEATPNHRERPAPGATSVTDELAAMKRIVAALDGLDQDARSRVLHWLADRYASRAPQ